MTQDKAPHGDGQEVPAGDEKDDNKEKEIEWSPGLLQSQLALVEEARKRNLITEEEYQQRCERLPIEDDERHAKYIEKYYKKYKVPQMIQRALDAHAREQRREARKSNRWLSSGNPEPASHPFACLAPDWEEDDAEIARAKSRKQAEARVDCGQDCTAQPLEWLWSGRLPLGKVSLLTGGEEGKSLVAGDLIARVTAGREWPDGSPPCEPADALLIVPDAGRGNVLLPRWRAAGADLSRVRVLSWVDWTDCNSGQPDGDSFRLPDDGPLLERTLEQYEQVRLIVIDPLSEFLALPETSAECQAALHGVLSDLEGVAEDFRCAILCVETAQPGGISPVPSGRQWRAHYDSAFATVWGVARDPRDRGRRLFLPVRHHLGDDRTGFQWTVKPCGLGARRVGRSGRLDHLRRGDRPRPPEPRHLELLPNRRRRSLAAGVPERRREAVRGDLQRRPRRRIYRVSDAIGTPPSRFQI